MKLNFQQDVLVIPASVLSCCADANDAAMRVLLWLASDLSLADKPQQLAKLADCDPKSLKSILQFWKMYGVLCDGGEDALPAMATVTESKATEEKPEKKTAKTHLRRADELPNYTSVEIATLLEQRASVRVLIDEAQQILGKIFNPTEVNILIGMLDYLGMSEECVLLLLAHCRRIEKTGMRAIEKYAITLADRGIVSTEAMEEEIRRAELMHSFEGQVRGLFGMQARRALTTRESKMLAAWVSFGYDIEIVREAYEMTVNVTGEASLPYANSILERWNAEDLRTLDQIRAANEADKAKRAAQKSATELGNSFDTDDFFEAALKKGFRTHRDD